MRKSTAILATVALGSVLAVSSATESMARGGGFHGGTPFIHRGGGFGGRAFGGRAFGGRQFAMRNGGFGMRHGFNRGHGFYGGRHFGRFRGDDDFLAFGLGSLWGPGQYWAYNAYGGHPGGYCERYIGRHGVVRYYCP
jgi:hypothetical protein